MPFNRHTYASIAIIHRILFPMHVHIGQLFRSRDNSKNSRIIVAVLMDFKNIVFVHETQIA